MIHILFGQSASGTLKYVLKNLGQTKKEHVISFWEMFSVGPIWTSENSNEQTGLRHVLYLLKDKTNKVKIINTTKVFMELFSQPNI